MFLTPKAFWPAGPMFPPDNYDHWTNACRALKELKGLRFLCVELVVGDTNFRHLSTTVDDESLLAILQPLNGLRLDIFVVEISLEVNERVRERLGELAFTVVVRKRPYNSVLFT
jgi:hypothetical protein